MIKLFVTGLLIILVSFFLVLKDLIPQYPFIPFLTGAAGFILMVGAAMSSGSGKSKPHRRK